MPAGGHTTVIQRILERRAYKPPAPDEGTTATLAVMTRVVQPPKALIACQNDDVRQRFERRILPDVFETECAEPDLQALRRCGAGLFVAVFTDSLELVRQIRLRPTPPSPFVLFVSNLTRTRNGQRGSWPARMNAWRGASAIGNSTPGSAPCGG